MLVRSECAQLDEPHGSAVAGTERTAAGFRDRTVVIGGLNSNAIWDGHHPAELNHSALVGLLSDLGLVGSYHHFYGEVRGSETRPASCRVMDAIHINRAQEHWAAPRARSGHPRKRWHDESSARPPAGRTSSTFRDSGG